MNLTKGAILFLNGVRMTTGQIQAAVRKRGKEINEAMVLANKKASIVLYQWVLRNFQGEGELAGGWAPLAEATIAYKEAHGYRMKLQNTGALRASFLPYSDDKIASVGSPLWYSRTHEEGTGRVPQRKILPTAEQAQPLVMPIYGREMKIVTGRPL